MVTISGENLIEHLEAAEAAGFTHPVCCPTPPPRCRSRWRQQGEGGEPRQGDRGGRREGFAAQGRIAGSQWPIRNTKPHDLPSAAADQGSDLAAGAGRRSRHAAAGPARQGVKPPGPLRRLLTEESGIFDPQARFRQRPAEEQPLLYHGSPEGELETIDTLYHTKPWREGPASTSPPTRRRRSSTPGARRRRQSAARPGREG